MDRMHSSHSDCSMHGHSLTRTFEPFFLLMSDSCACFGNRKILVLLWGLINVDVVGEANHVAVSSNVSLILCMLTEDINDGPEGFPNFFLVQSSPEPGIGTSPCALSVLYPSMIVVASVGAATMKGEICIIFCFCKPGSGIDIFAFPSWGISELFAASSLVLDGTLCRRHDGKLRLSRCFGTRSAAAPVSM